MYTIYLVDLDFRDVRGNNIRYIWHNCLIEIISILLNDIIIIIRAQRSKTVHYAYQNAAPSVNTFSISAADIWSGWMSDFWGFRMLQLLNVMSIMCLWEMLRDHSMSHQLVIKIFTAHHEMSWFFRLTFHSCAIVF